MKKRIIGLVLVSALTVCAFAGCAQRGTQTQTATSGSAASADQTYTWRMAHEEYTNDMQDIYCKEFAEKLNENSDGKINLQIYGVGQIGDALQQCELLQNNGLEFAMISPGNTGTIVPENQLFSLHFLFPEDLEDAQKIMDTSEALNTDLAAKYLEKNIQVLSFWTEGAMQWTSNKPLQTPDDFVGLKIRTMQSPMIVAAYEAYGANPTPMSYTEVYSGLQLNMIDAQENPISAIQSSKFYEVQKYLTAANSNIYVTATCVNPTFFNGLPEDIQQIILDTAEEMKPRAYEIQRDKNDEALALIQEANPDIIVEGITDEGRAQFEEKALTAYDKYDELVGADGAAILDKLLAEIEAYEASAQ